MTTATETITVLGKTFSSEEERRAYFREELRKKLPELKKMEGFPIGEDDDILNLSDPPYYTACPNPWLNDFIEEWEEEKKELEKEGKRIADFEVDEPYASDVSEGKNNPIYNAHSYYTLLSVLDTHNVGRGRESIPAALKQIESYFFESILTNDKIAFEYSSGLLKSSAKPRLFLVIGQYPIFKFDNIGFPLAIY